MRIRDRKFPPQVTIAVRCPLCNGMTLFALAKRTPCDGRALSESEMRNNLCLLDSKSRVRA